MAAWLGAESLAARFKAGDGLEGYFGRWLLLEAAGGDVEAEDNLATSRQIPLIRIAVGEKLNMEDIGTSWYPFKKKELQGKTKGSRQSTTVQLPTAILRNMGVYLKYIDSVRADESDMNQLLVAAWDGLRSRTAIGHWAKRGK